jgi:hypothetical protein
MKKDLTFTVYARIVNIPVPVDILVVNRVVCSFVSRSGVVLVLTGTSVAGTRKELCLRLK